MTQIPHLAAIHDLSGFGRCSLGVALPILSVMGVQCTVLPTAYLSTHTAFPGFTFLDLTEEMRKTMAHWKAMGLRFDAVYSGFLGGVAQIDVVSDFIRTFCKQGALAVVDPVMGDHGHRYATYTDEMCAAMRRLASLADVITPNLTEAAFLLEEEYGAMERGEDALAALAKRLSERYDCAVVLTGASGDTGAIGAVVCAPGGKKVDFVWTERIPGEYHGTGDVFASVLTGALMQGKSLLQAAELAVQFVHDCAARTYDGSDTLYQSVDFEPLLASLGNRA